MIKDSSPVCKATMFANTTNFLAIFWLMFGWQAAAAPTADGLQEEEEQEEMEQQPMGRTPLVQWQIIEEAIQVARQEERHLLSLSADPSFGGDPKDIHVSILYSGCILHSQAE